MILGRLSLVRHMSIMSRLKARQIRLQQHTQEQRPQQIAATDDSQFSVDGIAKQARPNRTRDSVAVRAAEKITDSPLEYRTLLPLTNAQLTASSSPAAAAAPVDVAALAAEAADIRIRARMHRRMRQDVDSLTRGSVSLPSEATDATLPRPRLLNLELLRNPVLLPVDFSDPIYPPLHLQSFLSVAVIGTPNVGKSTLVNQLVQRRVSSMSPKEHTTTHRVSAVVSIKRKQILFFDTPGVTETAFARRLRLSREHVTSPLEALQEAHLTMYVIDASKSVNVQQDILNAWKLYPQEEDAPKLLVLNKVDAVRHKDRLLRYIDEAQERIPFKFKDVFLISAQTGDGVGKLKEFLYKYPKVLSKWQFSPLQKSLQSPMEFFEDLVREQMLIHYREEVPYNFTQASLQWSIEENGALVIHHEIFVPRLNAKRIVVGRDGKALGSLASNLETQLSKAFHLPVSVNISVRNT